LIKDHKYGFDEKTIYLKLRNDLPENNWWKDQFQIEKCKDGSVHFHINNIRLSLTWEDYLKIFEAKKNENIE
jgi:hypothetical protein